MPNIIRFFISILLLLSVALVQADLAPGYGALSFKVEKPGSYQLPVVGLAADGEVLDQDNNLITLHDLFGDKIVLLSFIYSTCSDVNGCPLATAVFHQISRRLQKSPELAGKLRLLTLSFNPEHDTPEAMKRYAQGFKNSGLDWRFLTTRSEKQLVPILAGYRQNVQKIYDKQGRFTGTFSHVLKVFLIDHDKQIRNIYSVDFLHADTLINDIKTLLQESFHPQRQMPRTPKTQALDLLQSLQKPPLGLPPIPVPENNPITKEKIALGRKLFFDRRLSLNNTFSCAMCHIPEQGFSSNEMATAVGIEGRTVRRNSPTIYNVAYLTRLFHDGREYTLEQQAWAPLLAHNEMGNPSIGYVLEKIRQWPDYQGLFQQAFQADVNMLNLGQALASYQRVLVSANSPFDRWYFGNDAKAMSESAKKGFKLFTGKAQCSQCHLVGERQAIFTDNRLHNTGIGYAAAMSPNNTQKVQLAPGVFVEVDARVIEAVAEPVPNDLGLYEITQRPEDLWKYRTPSLRNIALTAPYMHDGSLPTLKAVIRFYNQGGYVNPYLDASIKPLNLTEQEMIQLEAFLKALTGSNVRQLVADALAEPVGN
jgi:cytochrome c peroxidase